MLLATISLIFITNLFWRTFDMLFYKSKIPIPFKRLNLEIFIGPVLQRILKSLKFYLPFNDVVAKSRSLKLLFTESFYSLLPKFKILIYFQQQINWSSYLNPSTVELFHFFYLLYIFFSFLHLPYYIISSHLLSPSRHFLFVSLHNNHSLSLSPYPRLEIWRIFFKSY